MALQSLESSRSSAGEWGFVRQILSETFAAYVDDDMLSRGAAIAFYSVIAMAPVLIVVIWIAGSVFGRDAARAAIAWQFQTLMGPASASLLLSILESASYRARGVLSGALEIGTLIIAASGVFGEIQSAFNIVWKAKLEGTTLTRLFRARAVSMGLVIALGFFLLVSLTVTAAMVAFGQFVNAHVPLGRDVLIGLNFVMSFLLLSLLFAAIYKVLPDVDLKWKDVAVGGFATAILFDLGKFLIGFYIGRSAIAASFGAAGALVIILLWIYYSAQLLLIGAEFTKVYSKNYGSRRGSAAAIKAQIH